LPDWPPTRSRDVGIEIDTATLSWFKANHSNWRRDIRLVLKAWVAAQTAASPAQAVAAPPTVEGERVLPAP